MYKIVCHLQKLFHVALLLLPVAANAGDFHRESSRRHGEETHNLDADEQSRLRVVWHAPREKNGYLRIQGKLFLESKDRKSKDPIDWIQGVRVVISRKPNVLPDWSKGHDDSDSVWDDCVIWKNGSFDAKFSVVNINRTVGKTEGFQIGLCLALKSGTTITWKSTLPILPQTVATIPIAGPRPINETLQIINASPSIDLKTYDPAALIRAVNHLHSLGKTKAIAALSDFLKIAKHSDVIYRNRDPVNIDTSDRRCVFLIVQLLFEPENHKEKRPPIGLGGRHPPKEDESLWPHFPLYLYDDVPFLVAHGNFFTGLPHDPRAHVEWAKKHGTLRKSVLVPSDNPLDSVDLFVSLPKTKRLFGKPSINGSSGTVRRQAWRMIENVVGPPRSDNAFFSRRGNDAESDWQKHKMIAKPNQLLWDAIHQRYTQKVGQAVPDDGVDVKLIRYPMIDVPSFWVGIFFF